MSNEELAQRIQAGESGLVAELWERNKGLFSLLARKYYNRKEELCKSRGVALEDLEQCGYFAMLEAVEDYSPESGYKFTSFVRFHALNQYNGIMGLRTQRQAKEPLNTAEALETPLPGEEDITLLDSLEDKQAAGEFEETEQVIYNTQLHDKLNEIMGRALTEPQREIIKGRYYAGLTQRELGEQQSKSHQRIRQIEQEALRKLRQPQYCRELRPFLEWCSWFYTGGFQSFTEHRASNVELITEKIERWEREHGKPISYGYKAALIHDTLHGK